METPGETQLAARRLALLTRAAGSVLTTPRLDEALPRVLDLAREALAADAYAIWRDGPAPLGWRVLAQSGLSDGYVRESTALLSLGALPTAPLAVQDADAQPLLALHPELQRQEGIESLLAIPLVLSGSSSGTLIFYFRRRTRFSRADVDAATLAGSLASSAMVNAELHESSLRTGERYRFLADHGRDIVVRISATGVLLEVSPAVRRVLGYDPQELAGMEVASIVHPEDIARFRALGAEAIEQELQSVRYRHVEGGWVHMEANVRVVRDPDGRPREFVTSLRDTSVRRAIERDLRLHERVLENMVEGVSVATSEGIILYTNPAEDRMFGYARGELLGQHLTIQNAYPPEENARVVADVIERLRTRGYWEGEFENVRKDASRFTSVARITAVEIDGAPHWVCVQEDVTERKRAQQEAQALRAQLIQGEKLSALGQLVSGVAHELRTPLTFLNNNAFLLRQRLERAARRGAGAEEALAEAGPYLDELTSGVDRINALVGDLRRYTRARSDLTLVEASLHSVASDAVELFRAAHRGAHPILTSLSATAPARVNVGSLQQLVLNLLQNAVEASPAGKPVRVTTRDASDGVLLEVADEGAGIPESVRARMFEPLFTTKAEGTGLGLSIVKRIVEEHGARIECESGVEKGTTFRVVFARA